MGSCQQAELTMNDELLPNRIDQIAEADPNRIWAEFPRSFSSYDEGYTSVSYSQLSNAVNAAAHWIAEEFGNGLRFETVAYSGPNDVRTPIAVLGAVKAGYKILLTSPRNSIAAHAHLFKQTNCQHYIVADPEPGHVPDLCKHLGITPHRFPALSSFLDAKHVQYPFNKTFEEAKMEPLVVIHTSGSTGFPKPLVLPHLFATRYANNQLLPASRGFSNQSRFFHGVRLIHTLPMFHAAGIYHVMMSTVFSGTTYVFLRPDVPPSAEGIAEALQHTEAAAIFVAPSVVEEIGKSDRLLELLAGRLQAICFAGGALSKPLGDRIAKRTRLISLYGSSELSQGIQLRIPGVDTDEDWSYQRWDEEAAGMEFREEAGDLYQLVIVKQPGREKHQPPFAIFPDAEEFCTKDLFRPHPFKKGLWSHAGRTDDLVVLSNGEKINPISMEGQISSHPKVNGALVAGEQRFRVVLLLEIKGTVPETASDRALFVEELWPVVESANESAPRHARLTKDHVLFVSADRPMVRAGKGTIVRKATLELYKQDIDELYEAAELAKPVTSLPPEEQVRLDNRADVVKFVSEVVKNLTGWKELDHGRNFFSLGLDSLQAIMLVAQIKALAYKPNISVHSIYSNPSVDALSDHLLKFKDSSADGDEEDDAVRVQRISSVYDKLAARIDQIAHERRATADARRIEEPAGSVILLTGSSGFAGSYILRHLLESPQVQRVYCLDRPVRNGNRANRVQRVRASNYNELLQDSRARVRYGTLSQAGFGLPEEEFAELRDSVDTIIHAAWAVDFNQRLDEYDDQLQGMVGLFSFVSQSAKAPGLVFVSSISSVQRWTERVPVPETISTQALHAAKTGYGESKHIAERLADHAASKLGQGILVLRAGQIAGPLVGDGGWNRYEWLPSLVASSAYLGALPNALGEESETAAAMSSEPSAAQLVDWIPVDVFARVVVEAAAQMQKADRVTHAAVMHVANPRLGTWAALVPGIASKLQGSSSQGVAVVSFADWVARLERSVREVEARAAPELEAYAAACPAVKLLRFFQDRANGDLTPRLDTTLAQSSSPSLAGAVPLSLPVLLRWMDGWLGRA